MSSTKELIKNAVKNAEITDYIMLIRGECMTVVLVEDFIKDIVFGGELICDTLLGCWKTMGQFDGGVDPENGDDEPCNCDDNFVKIHFPKGEGIKVITNEDQAVTPDSIYILATTVPGDTPEYYYELIVVDEEGVKRKMKDPIIPTVDYPVVDGKSSSDVGVPIYDGLDSTDKKIKLLPIVSDTINFQRKIEDGKAVLRGEIIQGADENLKQFDVNENYPYTGNGSISKPYSKFTNALKAVIGNGSVINPQYKNAKIKLQSNVTVTQADLDAVPLLENTISVNTANITSESNYTINYQGTAISASVSPVSTAFLKQKAISTSFIGEVYLTFNNITIYSETVKSIADFEVFQNSDFSTEHNFTNFTIDGSYQINDSGVYNPLINAGSPVILFGSPVYQQTTAISNTSSTVYMHGINNSGVGSFNISGYFKVKGSSQTFLKIENSAISFDVLSLEHNSYYLSLDNTTNKNPKSGIHRLEIINSFVNIQEIKSDEETSGFGGNDSFIRYVDNSSYQGSNLIINKGNIYHARFNKILSLNTNNAKVINISNSNFVKTETIISDLYNENGSSPIREVGVENSYFLNIKQPSLSGISVTANLASINSSIYSNLPYYPDSSSAIAGGLIPGNLYMTAIGTIMKVI